MNTNFIIMGLPSSGKTTFLAALWHLVEANEVKCRLKFESCHGNFSYLHQIAEAWRTFRRVPRTSQTGEQDVIIELINPDTGQKARAFFPDLAGETFDRQVEERICKPAFVEELSKNNGILFFINADVKEDGLSIGELNARLPAEAQISAISSGEDSYKESTKFQEWEPKHLPAQVKIVQLFSDMIRPPFEPMRRRVAVMISAWDLTREMQLTPEHWLATHMPLVSQFLRSNHDYFDYQIYGVSAQGVRLEDDQAVDRVLHDLPSRRIQIVGPNEDSNDLTEPLVWLMSVKE